MKRPFESLTEGLVNNLERQRENQLYNFSNSEKFLIWIVGFSIGGLSIIFANLPTLKECYSEDVLKTVLILLAISILSGMIYRWTFYKFQLYYLNIEFYLKGAFSKNEMMQINPINLAEVMDVNYIVYCLNKDYDLDYNYILENYNNLGREQQIKTINELKMIYNQNAESVKREYDFTVDYIAETYAKAFGYKKEFIERKMQESSAKRFRIYGAITGVMYILSFFTFFSVIVLLTVLY